MAADGAVDKMNKIGLQPDYIIGDGDSFTEKTCGSGVKIVRMTDQNSTDFEKCIAFAKNNNLLPSLILGINGGEIDHILGNIQALLKHSDGLDLYFLDFYPKYNTGDTRLGMKLGFPLTNQKFRTKIKKGTTVSILPFYPTRITSKGLYWELSDQLLKPNGILGIRNKAHSDFMEIHVIEGRVLVVLDITNYDFEQLV